MSKKKRRRVVKLGLDSTAQHDFYEVRCDGCDGSLCPTLSRIEVPVGKEYPTLAKALKALGWERYTLISGEGESERHRCCECRTGKPLGWCRPGGGSIVARVDAVEG